METGMGVDALGIYLTGAASAGGVQPDCALSLGGYRSSTRSSDLAFVVNADGIGGARVSNVTGACSIGEAGV